MARIDPHATRDHWDRMAATYDAAKSRNHGYYGLLKGCIDAAVPTHLRGRVLDAGCGTGQLLAALRPREGVGIDASQRMIDAARRAFADRPELSFTAMDAAAAGDLAARGGPFDAVISADLLEHVDDWPAVVRAMAAACRPGGVVAIATPNPRWALPLWLLEKARLKMPEGPHRFVPARAIAAELTAAGCTIRRCTTHAALPAHCAGIGPRLSTYAERCPGLRGLGVIQLVVGERR